ncbi:thiol:disulfide interchange protein [Salmonella enterica subsp. salamae]|uniref:Thiol:disulfide interchange protein n=2 Tax=Salmonella enterica TaxID=28901 RepID=A0A763QYT7_SALER|nr:thiol:disulfide interchange protein [Salmonella enterica subsp. salamae]EEO8344811.1 thioredoxin domain-containing protein [Salmonella enterica]ECI3454280.1 thiol:disulfide interchange protein [Salmonella enterica subsp. salamae]ECJ2327118.1 thiol:disulfide interchange protein [Salmonella enterica subsp. salamae]HAG4415459.1 thioredoxin domain-containing protein [Salmonella enterica]
MSLNHNHLPTFLKGGLLSFLLFGCISSADAREWEPVTPPVADAPAVVIFFSFYCPPCYAFSQIIGVDHAIRQVLPEGDRIVKYHVSQLGPLGHELTRAWALAIVMNETEPVERAFFTASMMEKSLNRPEDIRRVFIGATGISGETYDREIKSQAVNEVVKKQEALFKAYGVRGTPSVYVRGRYHISNAAFNTSSVDDFRNRYTSVIRTLLVGKNGGN